VILNRTKIKAIQLAKQFACRGEGIENLVEECKAGYDILIHAASGDFPLDSQCILPGTLLMDINTLPTSSEFYQRGREKGCTLVSGYEMFVNQAISQFGIWFDDKIDRRKIKELWSRKKGNNSFLFLSCLSCHPVFFLYKPD